MKELAEYICKTVEIEMDNGDIIRGDVINMTFKDESDIGEDELDIISADGFAYACPESMIKSIKEI